MELVRVKERETMQAWSTFEVKSFDEDLGIIKGIASTPETDRGGDIIEPLGMQFSLPMPFLFQHDKNQPIGWVTGATPNAKGVPVEIKIDKDAPLEYVQKAWTMIKRGLVRGLSIGFKGLDGEQIKGTMGIRFTKTLWAELSAVTIPMNEHATILTVKSFDQAALAKSGETAKPVVDTVKTIAAEVPASKRRNRNMSTQESIASWEAKRAANAAAMVNILKVKDEESRSTTTEEAAEFDRLEDENSRIDADLVRYRQVELQSKQTATPIPAKAGTDESVSLKVRSGDAIMRPNKNLEPGIGMARYVKAFAFSRGNYQLAAEYAKQWDDSTPEVGLALKTAVAAGTTTDSVWAGPLVYAQDFPAAFLEYLRPQTIMGKISGMKQVPFNIRYAIQDGGSTVAWVGQGLAKPVSKLHFTSGTLGIAKAAGIVIITQELARFSSPSAERVVRDDLTAQMRQFLDQQFIDPGVAAVSNVSPASVTNGAGAVRQAAAAWTTQAAVITDLSAFFALFSAQEIPINNGVWVTTPAIALQLSMLMNTAGTAVAFPSVTPNGGTFFGMPMIVSNSVPHSTSAGSILVLLIPELIYMADEGGIAIDQSTEASIEMDTAPTGTSATPTATTLVSMFQTNSIAIRVERIINWSRARSYGAGYIDNIH